MATEPTIEEAQAILGALAEAFHATSADLLSPADPPSRKELGSATGPDYEARYKALIERIPAVVFVAPLESGKGEAYVSPQIETILGFTQEQWLEDPLRWYAQVHPDDKQRWSTEAASLFISGQPLSSNYRVIARDGRVVWFQCDARMVYSDDGNPSFIHGIGFDVTELKEAEASLIRARNELEMRVEERTQALALTNRQLKEEIAEHKRTELLLIAAKEAAEESARVKDEFMANISHEIRSPMNGILGLTSLVLSTELSPEQRKHLLLAHSSAESLMSVINQVLDFSKLGSGKAELEPASFYLRSGIETLIGELKYTAEQKGLTLSYRISPETPDFLTGDAGRLRQVLVNLIGNAIKFTLAGPVYLEIALDTSIGREDRSAYTLQFSVTDSGIGIPAATLDSIFEPFAQADGSITRLYGGTGLGLAISKELVAMMNGRIWVKSTLGSGSTFFFTADFGIPVAELEVDEMASPGPSDHFPSVSNPIRNGLTLRVLVAEDNLVNQAVVTAVLVRSGHSVTMASNGREALEAYSKSSFDIVLMDIQMPVMDGLSATRAIRVIEARSYDSHVPIIGLSAHALETDRARCIEVGMDKYLSKPFKGSELISLMDELTGGCKNSS